MARALGLVLDLSFAGFVSVLDADRPWAQRWRPPGARYDDIGDWVGGVLREAGGGFFDLAWICAGLGPGSFTGIRIAMAFAQGLALPRDLPLHGFTAFAPLFLSLPIEAGKKYLAAIPANAGRFYVAQGLDVTGSILTAEELIRLAADSELIIPAEVPAFDSVLPAFRRVHSVADRWDVSGLAKYARASGVGAMRPHYLQPSAAEIKNAEAISRSGAAPA